MSVDAIEKIVIRDSLGRISGSIERPLSREHEFVLEHWPRVRAALATPQMRANQKPRITLRLTPSFASDGRGIVDRLWDHIVNEGLDGSRDFEFDTINYREGQTFTHSSGNVYKVINGDWKLIQPVVEGS